MHAIEIETKDLKMMMRNIQNQQKIKINLKCISNNYAYMQKI